MPARHGGPRVHSNNASRGAGRACAGLGHCGSLRARGACFAPELLLSETLTSFSCCWGVGERRVDLGVPIGFQHFPGPQLFGGRKDPRHLCFVVIMVGVGAQVLFVV